MLNPGKNRQRIQHMPFLAVSTKCHQADSTSRLFLLLICAEEPQLSTDLSLGVGWGEGRMPSEEGNKLNRYAIELKARVAQKNLARPKNHLIPRCGARSQGPEIGSRFGNWAS